MPNIAWGLDLGNRALKAVKLVREGGRIRIEDFEVIEHEQILSMAGDNRDSLIQSALAQFIQRHQTKNLPVAIGVSGQQSFARLIKLPPVEPKRIPEIVKFEAIQQIPFPLADVEWAYQLFQQKDSPDVEVGIFAMKKDLVNRQIEYFKSLHADVEVVQMSPVAVYNAMMFDNRVAEPTMFMDMGAENTDLVIADGATVWLRTLPIGGNSFTETLGKMFKLTFPKAEELKRNAATSKYAKQIFQAMRPVFADLVSEIQRSIGFYSTVHRDSRIAKIVVLGSTFQLPGLQKYLQQNLQLPIEKLDGFTADSPADAKAAAALGENSVTLATAYGLALQALGEGSVTSSLLPEAICRAKMWKAKTKWFAAAAALILLGTAAAGGMAYYHMFQYEQAKEVRRVNENTLATAKNRVSVWQSEVESKGETDRVRLTQLQSLQSYRETWMNILGDILMAAPPFERAKVAGMQRAQRPIIFIDQIRSAYRYDVTHAANARDDFPKYADEVNSPDVIGIQPAAGAPTGGFYDRSGRGGPVAAPVTPDAQAKPEDGKNRGFLVLVEGHTPNSNRAFVDTAFVNNLKTRTAEAMRKAGKDWYVARAELISSGNRITKDPNATGNVPAGGFGPRGGGFRQPTFGAGQQPSVNIPQDDPDLKTDLTQGLQGSGFGIGGSGFAPAPMGLPGRAIVRPGAVNPNVPGEEPEEKVIENEDPNFPGEQFNDDQVFKVLLVIRMDPAPKQDTQATPTDEAR